MKLKTVLFGPFLGEFGWEIRRWSGWVRWYKINNPGYRVIAVTRDSSIDLYYGCVDEVVGVSVDGDYDRHQPMARRLNGFDYKPLAQELLKKYNQDKTYNTHGALIMGFDSMDFNYTPRIENKRILEKHFDGRKRIVVAPRFRMGLGRNWPVDSWAELIVLLKAENYQVIIAGHSNSTWIPPEEYRCLVLNDLVEQGTSLAGLTIEAIRASCCTVGSQSGVPILSNLLGTPTVMWGHEQERHQTSENTKKTKCVYILDKDYNCRSSAVMEGINEAIQ